MDSYEATRIVFSRIQNFDPENASKIMGLLLIQDHGEKEMIRLAFGPEALVHSVILKARKELGLPLNLSPATPSTPSSSPSVPFLTSNPIAISRQNSSSSSSTCRLSLTIPNSSWSATTVFSDLQTPEDHLNNLPTSSSSSSSSSSSTASMSNASLPFYQNGSGNDIMDDFQLQDQLSFLNEAGSLSPTNDQASSASCFTSYNWPSSSSPVHRRSCSVSDMCLGGGSEDPNSGFGWKPCLYFARGFCKNGNSCRFLHGGEQADQMVVGSPNGGNKIENMMEQCHHHHHHELLRSKSASSHHQRLVSASHQQLMASNSFPYSPKCVNFLLQHQQNESQRAAAAALMMGEDLHKFGRSRLERHEFAMNGVNPASRQIYLTFPADSTFREEDVSSYFSIYGPVQDVRIPYQQKRMFGFVTFVYPETVKLILAKGNPHFVCDARVLVKPYKEKGKVQDKKQQQPQVERGDFSPCGTPTGLDSRDPFDLQLGARMFYNSQDMMWRRKLEEQAELQQALELQSRRLMGLQLLDVKKHHHRALSTSSPIQSPTQSHNLFTQSLVLSSIQNGSELPLENCSTPTPNLVDHQLQPPPVAAAKDSMVAANIDENGNDKESPRDEVGDLLESLEHNLPDSPFASPTKAGGGDYHHMAAFSGHVVANEANNIHDSDPSSAATNTTSPNMNLSTSLLPSSASTTLDMGSFKSFNCQMPRFSSGHGAIAMYASTAGGPKCPVGI
ncbi:Zinc finger CCCH domain-containing protein 22 [Morus notabilis]|uniref:Zinc finger CCCH domain-containing protein 22 n=1 Tax=Morus notabilis TaxID=981085 RepID=W9RMA9_9ROSA|nr:zinc finger CCCH domain-containing protein 22 isoform X2 [Morus notabilis]EXB97909.1 Zinc finger CCCH domain-containing protein 22 [Morus notabilis]